MAGAFFVQVSAASCGDLCPLCTQLLATRPVAVLLLPGLPCTACWRSWLRGLPGPVAVPCPVAGPCRKVASDVIHWDVERRSDWACAGSNVPHPTGLLLLPPLPCLPRAPLRRGPPPTLASPSPSCLPPAVGGPHAAVPPGTLRWEADVGKSSRQPGQCRLAPLADAGCNAVEERGV